MLIMNIKNFKTKYNLHDLISVIFLPLVGQNQNKSECYLWMLYHLRMLLRIPNAPPLPIRLPQ